MSKIDDIDRAILARAAQPSAPRTSALMGAKPYVAEAGQRLAEGLREENQRLKAERAAGMLVLRLDPKRVRATQFLNRDERAFLDSDPKFIELKESLRANGQKQPIQVRALAGDASADYEIVAGHRRHRACLVLDGIVPGRLSAAGAFRMPQSLNRGSWCLPCIARMRSGPMSPPHEKGAMFRQWLDEGIFAEQGDIATALNVSDATITKYLQIADLPSSVLAAFEDPRDIAVRWSHELAKAVKTNPARVEEAALRLTNTSPRPAANAVARTAHR